MNKKIFLSMLIAGVATLGVNAQQQQGKELNKEITLEKDFVPVVKKVTKKNTLPKVKKIAAPAKTDLKYSETPVNIEVPTTIPTMMPYGYRTAHNFSDKRGYLEVGGGMAANFDGSAGYRFVDSDNTQAGIWVQHNSTWAGKNRTPNVIAKYDGQQAKQIFNDNRAGLYFTNHFGTLGTLKLDAGVHFDSFNYYGAYKAEKEYNVDSKQTLLEGGINGKWDGKFNVKDNAVGYRVNLGFNHAGYDILPDANTEMKAASENIFNFGIGGDYLLENYGTVSLDLKGDYVNFKGCDKFPAIYPSSNNYFVFTVAPRYKWENDVFRAEAGVDLVFGDLQIYNEQEKSTSKFHIAPMAKIDVDIIDGVAIFADVKGGNRINSLSYMASVDRYSNPMGLFGNTWTLLDGEAGFKFGPFQGFGGKIFAGYAISEGALVNRVDLWDGGIPHYAYAYNKYEGRKMNGVKFGAEFNYKYRSLVDVAAKLTYAPSDGSADIVHGKTVKGYCLGLDGARMVAGLDLKVYPISKLTVNAGMDYRGQRKRIIDFDGLEDYVNLYAGANWRFDKVVSVWVKGSNLLNRKQDIMVGQGAQGITVMGGVSLVF